MKKIITFVFIIIFFLFALCYQSILIDRDVSDKAFTPNIFVSSANIKKTYPLVDAHSRAYAGRLNDSIDNCRYVTDNNKVIGAAWRVKYKNMTPENLLNYLRNCGLSPFEPLDDKKDLFSEKKIIFRNYHISQYLEGRYDKLNSTYIILYEYPNTFIAYEEKYSLKKFIKDVMIGTPH